MQVVGCYSHMSSSPAHQVRAIPVRKDDEVTVVRGTYKVREFGSGGRRGQRSWYHAFSLVEWLGICPTST